MSQADPIARFREVLERAIATGQDDPNAMCLATVDGLGRPSTRMVLLKDYDERGFVFYTNLESRKANDLRGNPNVSLTFFWRDLHQQIHIRGVVEPVSHEEAEEYFGTRPRGSQLGAWASEQSRPMKSRLTLLARVARIEAQYVGRAVPRPPFWSGFRVVPHAIEFWTAGAFRLHDRTLYERNGAGWSISTLYP